MKNVAGYDVSRLVSGSLGCLGIITEISLKVLPKPGASLTLAVNLDSAGDHRHEPVVGPPSASNSKLLA